MFREIFAEKENRERETFVSNVRRWGNYTELPRFFSDSVEYQRDGCCSSFYGKFLELWKNLGRVAAKPTKMGKSDPRNIVFSAKMGLALVLLSLLFLLKVPLKDSLWAALTVVVAFEFSIGATLSRGFSRGFGVLLAGGSALAIGELSQLVGNWGVVLAIIGIFITGFCTTYAKMHPAMKPYEYGVPVFLILCCFIMVSGYGTRKFIETALTPFLLIALGAGVSFLVNLSIFPIWAGQDLHNLVVQQFMSIATSLEGCISVWINCVEYERIPSQILTFQSSDDPVYSGYLAAMKSISQEDALLSYAFWEPPHGPYKMFKHPWMNYVRVSGALRHCAIMVMALHGCTLSEIQAPAEKRLVFRNELQRVGTESAKLLRLLGSKVKRMEKLDPGGDILGEVHEAAEELQNMVERKSYLFVNSESWEYGQQPRQEESEVVENYLDINDDESYLEEGESAIDVEPVRFSRSFSDMTHYVKLRLSRPGSGGFMPEIVADEHLSGTFSGGMLEMEADQWPEAPESLAYENASVLSLATFSFMLIEFVARLQNLVDCFEELSEKAMSEDPADLQEAAARVGFLRRFFNSQSTKVSLLFSGPDFSSMIIE